MLLEFASATVLRICRGELDRGRGEALLAGLEAFRGERLGLLETRGEDLLLARSWFRQDPAAGLQAGDALHLAVAHRQGLTVVRADQTLVRAVRGLEQRAELGILVKAPVCLCQKRLRKPSSPASTPPPAGIHPRCCSPE